jgi:hypothetical protein
MNAPAVRQSFCRICNCNCGLVSMAHASGGLPEEDDRFRELGSSTSRLLANDTAFERYSGQPRMSAVPVEIEPLR